MSRFVFMGIAASCLAVPAQSADIDTVGKRRLQQQLQADPDDTVVMAQLARVYLTGANPDRARALYRAMLSLDDVMLERSDGTSISSHLLARRGLATLATPQKVRLGSR